MKERDLREALTQKAQEFSMSDRPPVRLERTIRRRVALSLLRGVVVVTFLIGGGVFVVNGGPKRPAQGPERLPVAIELVDDYVDDGHNDGAQENPSSREKVQSHVECMREQGFELPDPIRTEHGWEIEVEEGESLEWETPQWREAAFVACRPSPPPGPGDLVLGVPLSERTIQDFARCIEAEGFDLPEPTPNPEGEGWIFDLSEREIDFGNEQWNRAVFVTCWAPEMGP